MIEQANLRIWGDAIKGGLLPFAILMLVILMVVPVPATVLDIGFIVNITISLAVLMVALNAAKPLDFSAFPTVLLLATLFRLALNVASTRVVLVNGHQGPGSAGHVIEAFGTFLIGGRLRQFADVLKKGMVGLFMAFHHLRFWNELFPDLFFALKVVIGVIQQRLQQFAQREYIPPYYLANINAQLGWLDQAFAHLEQAYRERSGWAPWLKYDPMADVLRHDARFSDLLRRVGLQP